MKEADIPYSLTLVAEIYIAMCLLCFLYILIEQRREPAPMMRVMLWGLAHHHAMGRSAWHMGIPH